MTIDLNQADQLMHDGAANRVFPGAVLAVMDKGDLVFQNAYGMADLFRGRAMTCDTVFDLASLTKPLATTLAIMLLVQTGQLELDQPCCRYWADFSREDKAEITIRHLLCHSSGLPAWRPYYMRLRHHPDAARRQLLQQWVVTEALEAPPGERVAYSDIGFFVLQWVAEMIGGLRLDRLLGERLWPSMAKVSVFFNDLRQPPPDLAYAATELCPWRSRLLTGQVHDDNAFVMGGVAGHAGLFGTATGVMALLRALLNADQGDRSKGPLEKETIQLFFQRQPGSTWALGFDTPSRTGSSSGGHFSADTVGHLGYTGTSFWMDRNTGVIVVLLTNRVHPSRYNDAIRRFRPLLHDAVMAGLGY